MTEFIVFWKKLNSVYVRKSVAQNANSKNHYRETFLAYISLALKKHHVFSLVLIRLLC